MTVASERFDRWIYTSVALHGALFAFVVFMPSIFPGGGETWGTETGGLSGINVKIVGAASGIMLPSPEVTRKDAVANESPGLYKAEEAPPPPPPDKAELIPDPKA